MPVQIGNWLGGINNFVKSHFKLAVGILVGFGMILAGLYVYLLFPQIRNLIIKPTPTPSSKISKTVPHATILPLPKGFQSWTFSYGNGYTGPKIQTATVDTLTPPPGSTQTVSVTIANDSPINKVSAVVYTDNNNNSYEMKLTKGTSTNGTWVGIWKLDDTYNYIYHITFEVESSSGNSQNALTFR